MSLKGFHGVIVLIPAAGIRQKGSLQKHLHAFLVKLLNALKSCQLGLTSTTIALVAEKNVQSTCHPLGGEWLPLSEVTPPVAPQHHTRVKQRRSAEKVGAHVRTLEPLERAIQALEEEMDSNIADLPLEQSGCTWGAMATQLHSLMDNTPWRPLDHTELSLYWLVSESEDIPPPESAVALYSALERVLVWHRGHVTITCDSPMTECAMHQWKRALRAPSVVLTENWSPSVGVFWRGAVHFTEHKTFHDAYLNTAVFQGFSLALMDRTMTSSVAMVMEGVGLDPRKPFIPTHLEVVQILDVSTVPHLLLSPLQCTLSLFNPQHADSARLFQQWFIGRPPLPNHVGFLMRLCLTERKEGTRRLTSADWFNHILTRDLPITATTVPSALDCYQPGPMILVCPGDHSKNTLSCDCWFLWQHKALHMHLLKELCPVVPVMQKVDRVNSIHDTCSHLPLLSVGSTAVERGEAFVDVDFTQFWKTVSGAKRDVDMSPSEWPEIQAMKTHEWIQRKLVHKSKTPDLLFGQPVPPPPPTTPENSLCVGSVLECFADDGSPAVCELSPVALQDPANMVKIFDPKGVDISFQSIAGTTPTSKKLIHGIQYCLSTDDLAMDARLQRLQQRCLASERSSHCFNSNTPLQERRCRPRTLDDDIIMDGQAVASTGAAASGHDGTKDVATSNLGGVAASSDCDQSREGPGAILRTHLGTKMRGRAPPTKRGTKRKLNLKLQPPPFDMGAGSSGDGLVTESDVPGRGAQASVAPGTLPRKPSVRTTKSSEVVPRPNAVSADLCAQHEEGPCTEDGSMCTVLPTITEGADTGVKRTEKEDNRESRKKLLEKTIVAVLKGSMAREHPCFRLCYNRLFNLCKTFLKDVRNSEQFADEMERTVNFNVKQVIEFELRQAGLDL